MRLHAATQDIVSIAAIPRRGKENCLLLGSGLSLELHSTPFSMQLWRYGDLLKIWLRSLVLLFGLSFAPVVVTFTFKSEFFVHIDIVQFD